MRFSAVIAGNRFILLSLEAPLGSNGYVLTDSIETVLLHAIIPCPRAEIPDSSEPAVSKGLQNTRYLCDDNIRLSTIDYSIFVSPFFLISIRNTACCIFNPGRNYSRFL